MVRLRVRVRVRIKVKVRDRGKYETSQLSSFCMFNYKSLQEII